MSDEQSDAEFLRWYASVQRTELERAGLEPKSSTYRSTVKEIDRLDAIADRLSRPPEFVAHDWIETNLREQLEARGAQLAARDAEIQKQADKITALTSVIDGVIAYTDTSRSLWVGASQRSIEFAADLHRSLTTQLAEIDHAATMIGEIRNESPPASAPPPAQPINLSAADRQSTGKPTAAPPPAQTPEPVAINPHIPATCNACGKPLLLENLFVCDGCPCNSPRGVNFAPQHCAICGIDCCVRPGHRLHQLFGSAARSD